MYVYVYVCVTCMCVRITVGSDVAQRESIRVWGFNSSLHTSILTYTHSHLQTLTYTHTHIYTLTSTLIRCFQTTIEYIGREAPLPWHNGHRTHFLEAIKYQSFMWSDLKRENKSREEKEKSWKKEKTRCVSVTERSSTPQTCPHTHFHTHTHIPTLSLSLSLALSHPLLHTILPLGPLIPTKGVEPCTTVNLIASFPSPFLPDRAETL